MRYDDFIRRQENKNKEKLCEIEKYAHTLSFQRKLNHSMKVLHDFFNQTNNPVISCGGGKDGTATAILACQVNPKVKIICANPPNPLPDRNEHIKNLKEYLDYDKWTDLSYDWDVDAVLRGDIPYPNDFKQLRLQEWEKDNGIDGVVLGLRANENNDRKINFKVNGHIYKTCKGLRCQPIADWSWQEVICLALLMDAPINPVYLKMDGIYNLDYLHDGTWWHHSYEDKSEWMKRYYPDYYDLYVRSTRLTSKTAAEF